MTGLYPPRRGLVGFFFLPSVRASDRFLDARFFAADDLTPVFGAPVFDAAFFDAAFFVSDLFAWDLLAATFSTAAFILFAPAPLMLGRSVADLFAIAAGLLAAVVEPVFRTDFFFRRGGAAPSSVARFNAFSS